MANLTYISIEPIVETPDVVGVDEAKLHCNCDVDTWDANFLQWIKAARVAIEQYTGHVLLKSNVVATYEKRKSLYERLNLSFSDNMVLNSGSRYVIENGSITTSDKLIVLSYTAGYDHDKIPSWMKQAVLMYVADLYENRGEQKLGEVGKDAFSYCSPFRVGGII